MTQNGDLEVASSGKSIESGAGSKWAPPKKATACKAINKACRADGVEKSKRSFPRQTTAKGTTVGRSARGCKEDAPIRAMEYWKTIERSTTPCGT